MDYSKIYFSISSEKSPLIIGIILLIIVILATVFMLIKYKRNEKKLPKKWIILLIVLTFCIPIWEVRIIGCHHTTVDYTNIYMITLLHK